MERQCDVCQIAGASLAPSMREIALDFFYCKSPFEIKWGYDPDAFIWSPNWKIASF